MGLKEYLEFFQLLGNEIKIYILKPTWRKIYKVMINKIHEKSSSVIFTKIIFHLDILKIMKYFKKKRNHKEKSNIVKAQTSKSRFYKSSKTLYNFYSMDMNI